MSKFKFAFTNIFLWLGIISSCLLVENHAFLTETPTDVLPDVYFYMLFTLAIASYVVLFVFEHIFNKTGVDYFLIAGLSVILIAGVLAIWLFRDINFFPDDPSQVISLSFYEKVRLSIGYGMFILTIYAILFIFTKNHFSLRSLSFLFIIVIGIVYFTLIYSLAAEMPDYIALFTNPTSTDEIKSLFWNTNVFSGTLVMGICSAMILNIIKKNVLSFISIFVFYIELFLTGSVLSLIIATGGVTIYFLVEIFLSLKKHLTRSLIFLGLELAGMVVLAMLFALSLSDLLGPFSKIFKTIYKSITNLDYSTFSNRVEIWQGVLDIVKDDPLKLVFGCGYNVCNVMINSKMASIYGSSTIASAHNGAMQILLCNGIVGLVIYAAFLIYFVYVAIRLMKNHTRYSLIYLIVGVIMLLYSFGESVIFFNCNVQGVLVGVLFYLPLIMKWKHIKHPEVKKALFATPYDNFAISNKRVAKITSFIIMSLLCALAPLLFMKAVREQTLLFALLIASEACLGVLWLGLPYCICQWHKDTTLKHFKIRLVLNFAYILVAFCFGVLMYFMIPHPPLAFRYGLPIILAAVLLLDAIYYSIIKKPSFKDFLGTFTSVYEMSLFGMIASAGGTILLLYFYQSGLENGPLIYIIVGVFSLLVFYAVNLLFMRKEMRYNVSYLNNIYLTAVKRQYLIENSREVAYV